MNLQHQNDIAVREALPEDCYDIWEWWNDPITRQMMKDNAIVPLESHQKWYEKALVDENRMLCIGVFNGAPFGIVRFLKEEDGVYEVSINLKSEVRGKGLGAMLMSESITMLKAKQKVALLFAMLKKLNYPSKRTFEKNDFEFKDPIKFYPKMSAFDPIEEFYCELRA